jgi:hypothetical protein
MAPHAPHATRSRRAAPTIQARAANALAAPSPLWWGRCTHAGYAPPPKLDRTSLLSETQSSTCHHAMLLPGAAAREGSERRPPAAPVCRLQTAQGSVPRVCARSPPPIDQIRLRQKHAGCAPPPAKACAFCRPPADLPGSLAPLVACPRASVGAGSVRLLPPHQLLCFLFVSASPSQQHLRAQRDDRSTSVIAHLVLQHPTGADGVSARWCQRARGHRPLQPPPDRAPARGAVLCCAALRCAALCCAVRCLG